MQLPANSAACRPVDCAMVGHGEHGAVAGLSPADSRVRGVARISATGGSTAARRNAAQPAASGFYSSGDPCSTGLLSEPLRCFTVESTDIANLSMF